MLRVLHIFLVLATIVLGAVGISRLSYDVDILDLLPRHLPGVEGTLLMRDLYERPDQLIVTIEAADAELAATAAEQLEAALMSESDLVRRVQSRPAWESHPEQFSSLAAYALLNAPPERLNKLRESLSPAKIKATLDAKMEKLATGLDTAEVMLGANDPLGLVDAAKAGIDPSLMTQAGGNEFSSADGAFRVLYVDASHPVKSYRACSDWVAQIKDRVGKWRAAHAEQSATVVSYTGTPAFQAEIGTGMEGDMSQSISGITFVVGFLFWLLHRSVRPLLLIMLSLIVAGLLTLGVAGLMFGSLNVMSMGFAAILMGMIEDFGVVGLHESLNHPTLSYAQIHRRVFPSVFWSAFTSALVFAALGLSVMPGIAQMGILTAIGILIGAAVMLYGFLPIAMRWKHSTRGISHTASSSSRFSQRAPAISAAVLLIFSIAVLAVRGVPGTNPGSNVLRPEHCESFDALARFQERIKPVDQSSGWLPLVLNGPSAAELRQAVDHVQPLLEKAKREGSIKSYFLPGALVPDAAAQTANRASMAALLHDRDRVFAATTEAGFNDDALHLSRAVFDAWQAWLAADASPRWPDPVLLEGMLGKVLHVSPQSCTAGGFVMFPSDIALADAPLVASLGKISGVHPAGWEFLTAQLKPLIHSEVLRVCVPAAIVLFVLLFFVFRNPREILIVLGSLTFSGLLLLAGMSLLGIRWNFVNIGIVPLCLGLGLDFNIHMIYSLRRLAQENESEARGLGKALAYCGLSTGLGFGALAMSGNVGLITFGQCSMIGVLATLYVAAFVVPWAWAKWR